MIQSENDVGGSTALSVHGGFSFLVKRVRARPFSLQDICSSIQDSTRSMIICDAPLVIAGPNPSPNATLLSCYRPPPRALRLGQAPPPPPWPSNRSSSAACQGLDLYPSVFLQQNLTYTAAASVMAECLHFGATNFWRTFCGASCKPAPDFSFLVDQNI